ncbi:general transcriptional corepressor trfA-like [Amphibalanus amphitrite]|uniref:general transcriptional corepressor trfA-like n=1 Tax=Amphibalanus amphitrite TaxID=1232801 RepID=UPI001C921380|nr:general transcriptional corepressor trfA-like [Amphibalanus amphitrite]XP_043228979.1 general transcriptional corepressor trfA-like [Amphibalanus amphitrite]
MSDQQVANIAPSGEITKQQSSQSESSQSYAIPGGEAHEQSRDASRLMEANIPGGQMKQQTQEHQFAKQAEAVQETPGGVQRTSEAAAAQQQVSQSVSNSQTQGADGSISTRRVTSKRTVQQSSSVKQSHISSTTSAHPAQGMIQAPVPTELQMQNLATQQNNQRTQLAHQQQQLAQQQQLPDLADSDMTAVSRKTTQHSHKKVTQTSQKVTSATQQQQQQQQLVQGTAHQQALNMP